MALSVEPLTTPGGRTMGAASSTDRSDAGSTATESDGSSRTLGPGMGGSGAATASGRDEARSRPTGPSPASIGDSIDPSSRPGLILGSVTEVRSSVSNVEETAADVGRTARYDCAPAGPTMPDAEGRATPAPRERPLLTIDGYEISGELGRGGMGVVYRAPEVRLNRPCVLKMILAGAHADAGSIARFLAEAEAVARLQHANVV